MARTYVCDRCGTCQNQADFDLYTVYRDNTKGKQTEAHKLELCPQCGVEFREFYRFAWVKEEAAS